MAVVANANALTTLAAVKAYLKIAIATDDDLLTGLINACSTAIENYCRRSFVVKTIDEYLDGNNHRLLNLKNYPIKTVNSINVNGADLAAADYVTKKDVGILARAGGSWPRGDYNIKVNYTAGFDTIPDDLELACKMFVASIYKADVAAFSTTFNEGFVFKADAIPVQVKLMLQPYVDTAGGIN